MSGFRVLHVIGGSQFGGIVPYVASLVRMARDRGGDASVLATAPRIVEYCRARNIEVLQIPGIDRPVNPLRDVAGLVRLVRHLRQHPYTVVHTHTSKGGIVGRLASRIAGTPMTIHTTQGYAFSDYATSGVSSWVYLHAERAATGWCDFIISANETDRLKAIEHQIVAESKIVTIPNGIDLDRADAELSLEAESVFRELQLDPARSVVGVMARLAPQKGIEFFIRAVPGIAERFPAAQFLIVGAGELQADLQVEAERVGMAGRIRFAGFRTDTYRVLRMMTVFVMPSLWEGLPLTLLEAMAARRPIIATRIKGVTDVCDGADVAFLVEPSDSAAIVDSVSRLLADPRAATELGRKAREHVERRFSDRLMTERTWDIYCSVAKRKGVSLNATGDRN